MGILDCDIFGPSLPILLKHENDRSAPFFLALTALVMAYNDSTWLPFKLQNMLCMSFGWMSSMTSSNIMRGPMVMSIIEQILNNTMWGDLDYLILDLPPGTGDVQLSLCQKLSLSGSVIVTTPQILSVADTEKGIRMFGKLKVPINALVENMSFFKCKHGETYYPFGENCGRFRLQGPPIGTGCRSTSRLRTRFRCRSICRFRKATSCRSWCRIPSLR